MATITVFEEPVQQVVIERRQSKQRISLDANKTELNDAKKEHIKKNILITKPVIETRLRNRLVDPNDNIQLMCSFSGRECHIRWYKDGLQIRNDDLKYRSSDSEGLAYLNIMNVSANECGEYRCNVSNAGGQSDTSGYITMSSNDTQMLARYRNVRISALNEHPTSTVNPPLPFIVLTNIKGTFHIINIFIFTSKSEREIVSCSIYTDDSLNECTG